MFLRASLIAFSLFSFAAATHAETGRTLAGNFLAGRSASKLRDNAAASEYFAAALAEDPKNPVLVERVFQSLLASGQLEKAEAMASEVISFNSQQRMARIVLGLKKLREHKYSDARSEFNESAYTPSGELIANLLNAWTFAGEGNINSAMKELDKLDAQENFQVFKLHHAALIADFLGSNLRAEAAYRKSFELSGTRLRVVQTYGNFFERNGKTAEAIKLYEGFLSTGQNNPLIEAALVGAKAGTKPSPIVASTENGVGEAMFTLAYAMNDEQSLDQAQQYAQLAMTFNAQDPVTRNLLGDILSDMKSYDKAIEIYEQVPAASPLRSYADIQIAIALHRLDKVKEATERLKSVVAKDAKNTGAWATLGNLYRVDSDWTNAIASYSEAIKQTPEKDVSWQLYYNRGQAFENQKKHDESEADFRKALSLSADEPSVLNYLGYSLIERGQKLDEAIMMVRKAVDLQPNNGYIVDSLGWAYYTMGDFEQAAGYLERAVDLSPGDAIIAEHLGDAYWHVNRKLEAGFQYQHAKDNKPEGEDLIRIEAKIKNGWTEPPNTKAAVKQ
jgi:tetratricopeptide (TPR) repeat protein